MQVWKLNNRNAAQSCDLGADGFCFAFVSQNAGIAHLKSARGSGPAVGLPLSGADQWHSPHGIAGKFKPESGFQDEYLVFVMPEIKLAS